MPTLDGTSGGHPWTNRLRCASEATHLVQGSDTVSRVVADCRTVPSEMNCSIVIAGEPEEVIPLAIHHAVTTHGHEDNAELREMAKTMLVPETATV